MYVIRTEREDQRSVELFDGSDLDKVTDRSTRFQVRTVQDPFPGCQRCQVLLIAQGSPNNDVGAAGVEGLFVQNNAT